MRGLIKLVGGILLGGVLVVLAACGGTTPTPSAPKATATAQQPSLQAPTSTAAPARTATATLALTPTAGASVPTSPVPTDDPLAKGKLLFEKTAGGVGCASCHGLNGKGTTTVGAPDVRGSSEARVRGALAGGVAMMSFIKLNDPEITAVVAYMRYLNEQP